MVLETNIDDSSPEMLGADFQNDLLGHGAIDFSMTAIQMKKGRPGIKLTILIKPNDLDHLSNFILENTSSIGLRYYQVNRKILERKQYTLDTKYGPIQVKEVFTPSGQKRYKIEYESLRNLKESHNISIFKLEEELYPLLYQLKSPS